MKAETIIDDTIAAAIVRDRGFPRRPSPPVSVVLPRGLIRSAHEHLWANGRRGLEQLVLWAGYLDGVRAVITSLLLPDTVATWGSVTIVRSELPKIADWLLERGQLLFVEMHTHGRGLWATELSDTDRTYPIGRQAGFITVIVPAYAADGIVLAKAGVWEYCPPEWLEVPRTDVRRRFEIAPDQQVRELVTS
jgi:hypothetical protein